MKNIFKSIILTIILVALTGCFAEKTKAISSLEDELKSDQNNALVHAKLAYQYYKESSKQQNLSLLNKAYEEANKALELEPNSLQIKGLLFDIGFTKMFLTSDKSIAEKLKTLFPDLHAANLNIAPPSYIDVLFVKKGDDATKKELKLLKKALKENPKFPNIYVSLSNIYIKKDRYNMAIDTLKRGLNNGFNKVKFHYLLAQAYMDQSYFLESKNGCAAGNDKLTKKIIKEAKEVLKLNPNVTEMYYTLSTGYERLGQKQLAIHTAKILHNKLNNNDTLSSYERYLVTNGGKKEFFKIMKEDSDLYTLSIAYFFDQNWEKSAYYLKKYIEKNNSDNIYRYMMLAISQAKVSGKNVMYNTLNNLPKNIILDDWKNELKEYLLGNTSQEKLLSLAQTKCKKTEAYFYIGFNYLIDNNQQKSREYFQKVLDEKLYSYIEYVASESFLN